MISSNIQKENSVQMASNKPQATIDNQNSQDPQSAIRNSNIAISVRNLSKKYQLYETPKQRLKEALHPFRKKYHHDFWALRDVSFEVKCGEILGIIGRNGSGKSTLLQIICGTLTPTQGDVNINGRVSALLELGAGFNPEFTGRDNVYMNAAIIGLSHQEIDARFEDITSFADIGDFIDQPVKIYSSGMYVRLAFAVAINVSPDILVIDEALSVGDVKFQRKCYSKIEEFRKSGKTILFVSHSTDSIVTLCDRAILLDHGQLVEQGEPKYITNLYLEKLFGHKINSKATDSEETQEEKTESMIVNNDPDEKESLKELILQKVDDFDDKGNPEETRFGNGEAEFIDFGILDQNGNRVSILETGKEYTFISRLLFYKDCDEAIIGMAIKNTPGVLLFAMNTYRSKVMIPPQKRRDVLETQIPFTIWLAPGEYFYSIGAWKLTPEQVYYDSRVDVIHFEVAGNDSIDPRSVVDLQANFKIKYISDIVEKKV